MSPTLDLRAYLRHYDQRFNTTELPDGSIKYVLEHCPFDIQHRAPDAAIFQNAEGAIGFKCFHNSCADKKWADVRVQLGPPLPSHLTESVHAGNGKPAKLAKPYTLATCSIRELLEDQTPLDWLIEEVCVIGQPILLGGASKSLKTSLATDLAISLATGGLFCGTFAARQCGVLFISAESGKAALRETCRRILAAKELTAWEEDIPLHWCFQSPQLANASHLGGLERKLEELRPGVLLLDPAYLIILGGLRDGQSNLAAVGACMSNVQQLCEQYGCTLIVLHHCLKTVARQIQTFTPLQLSDMHGAGFAEFTRQWILLTRVSPFIPRKYCHELHMSVGGSAGHSGEWQIFVDEGGEVANPLHDRVWKVSVASTDSRYISRSRAEDETAVKLLLSTSPRPLSKTEIRDALAWKAKRVADVLTSLLIDLEIQVTSATKGRGEFFSLV
jgi:hypothetical protein